MLHVIDLLWRPVLHGSIAKAKPKSNARTYTRTRPRPLLDGILCLTVRQVLLHDAERSMTARIALEELAMSVLTYELAEGYEAWGTSTHGPLTPTHDHHHHHILSSPHSMVSSLSPRLL